MSEKMATIYHQDKKRTCKFGVIFFLSWLPHIHLLCNCVLAVLLRRNLCLLWEVSHVIMKLGRWWCKLTGNWEKYPPRTSVILHFACLFQPANTEFLWMNCRYIHSEQLSIHKTGGSHDDKYAFSCGMCHPGLVRGHWHLRETCLLLYEKSAAVHTDVFKVLQITRPLTQEKYCK